jgi:hypothetical protein
MLEISGEYSASEVTFYGAKLDDLIQQIRLQVDDQWHRRLTEFIAGCAEIPRLPRQNFETILAQKQEEVAARLGLGRKYGAPRQAAQEKVSSLLVALATTKTNLVKITQDYLRSLADRNAEEADHWWRGVDKKFVTCTLTHPLVNWKPKLEEELLSATFFFARISVTLLTNLNLLKDEKKYDLKSFPVLKVFPKGSPIVEDLLAQITPGLNVAEKAETKFEAIKLDSFKTFEKAKIPEFMTAFFDRARASFDKFKSQLAVDMVEAIRDFRAHSFPEAVRAAFLRIQSGALDELRLFCDRFEAEVDAKLGDLEKRRTSHEKQLTPFLANPANRSILHALQEAEEARVGEHVVLNAEMESKFSRFMANFESTYIGRVREFFDTFLVLLDLTPLIPHIHGVPVELADRPALEVLIAKTQTQAKPIDLTGNVLEVTDLAQLPSRFGEASAARVPLGVSAAHAELARSREAAFASVERKFLERRARGEEKMKKTKELEEYNKKVWNMMMADLQGSN